MFLLAQCMRLVICEFINLFQNYNPNYNKYVAPERGEWSCSPSMYRYPIQDSWHCRIHRWISGSTAAMAKGNDPVLQVAQHQRSTRIAIAHVEPPLLVASTEIHFR